MYRKFAFEGSIHETLECVPLTVRRKLDLAELKISLVGWQALSREERLALCHLPAERAEDIAVYAEVMRGFAGRAGVELKPIPSGEAAARPWNSAAPTANIVSQAAAAGAIVRAEDWRVLDEETRYAMWKLADPVRPPAKMALLLGELGMLATAVPHREQEGPSTPATFGGLRGGCAS